MRLWVRGPLSVMVLFTNLSCSVNILENFADKNTNMAHYYEAQKLLNDADWDGAIAELDLINGSFANDRKVIGLRASAYGGKCGVTSYLTFVENLANMGATRLFPYLLSQFTSATSNSIDSCITAQNLMISIGAVSARTNDENMFILVMAFAKIGNILGFYGDSDHDGSRDSTYDTEVCTAGGARGAGNNMTDADAIEIGTGIALVIEQLTALSGVINLGSSSLTTVTNTCTALAAVSGGVDICSMTDTADWTDGSNDVVEMDALRSLVNEGTDVGIDACETGGDVVTCNCP